jgi:hypothetical protein
MPLLRSIRRADIPPELRTEFERYGEILIAMGLSQPQAASYSGPFFALISSHGNEAAAWLTERRDLDERRENRLELVGWAILLFVVIGVLADIAILLS